MKQQWCQWVERVEYDCDQEQAVREFYFNGKSRFFSSWSCEVNCQEWVDYQWSYKLDFKFMIRYA